MTDIYTYIDYRAYLRNFFAASKEANEAFSHMFFARKAGIRSSGFVHQVMAGNRNLTRPVLLKIARAVGLDAAQTEYFEDLVCFDQAKSQSDRQYYFERIAEHRRSIKVRTLDDKQYEFYSAWYHTVVREIITLLDKNTDPRALAKLLAPPVSPSQVKKSLKLQQELGIIKKKKGKFEQAEPFVSAGGAVRNLALVKFQRAMLEHARAAWDRFNTKDMTMSTVTLCMPEDLVEAVRKEVRKFKKKLYEIVGSDKRKSERVYHLNINLFPVSKAVKGARK